MLWSFGRIGSVSVSPDQKTLVYDVTYFNKEEDRSYSDIYVMNLADGKSKQLTDTDYKEFGETWTSDGKIAFMSSKSGSVQLWEMNADGSGLTQLTNIEGGIGGLHFLPGQIQTSFLERRETGTRCSRSSPRSSEGKRPLDRRSSISSLE